MDIKKVYEELKAELYEMAKKDAHDLYRTYGKDARWIYRDYKNVMMDISGGLEIATGIPDEAIEAILDDYAIELSQITLYGEYMPDEDEE